VGPLFFFSGFFFFWYFFKMSAEGLIWWSANFSSKKSILIKNGVNMQILRQKSRNHDENHG